MEVKCPNCRFKFDVNPNEDGVDVNCVCPRCGNKFSVKSPAPAKTKVDNTIIEQQEPTPNQPQQQVTVQTPAQVQQPEPQIVYVKRTAAKNNTLIYALVGIVAALLIICLFLLFNRQSSNERQYNEPVVTENSTQSVSEPVSEPPAAETVAPSSSLDGYYYLSGSLADLPVKMQFRIDGNNVTGTYIYSGISKVDIEIYGTIYGNRMELHEINEYGDHSGDFDGYFEGGNYTGTFHRYRNGRNDKNFDFYLHE